MAETRMRTIRKIAFGYAVLFLGVYSLDYVPGVMDTNGKMFGLFSMTPLVDAGHLVLGALALICGLISAKAARFYFWFLGIAYGLDVLIYAVSHLGKISPMTNLLVNLPHTLIFISAFIVALKIDRE
jgi:TM2 domain-containing membrane protein YozV